MIKGKTTTVIVAGKEFKVWSDFIARGTFAENEAGEVKQISFNGYIKNNQTVRKAIQSAFQLCETNQINNKEEIRK